MNTYHPKATIEVVPALPDDRLQHITMTPTSIHTRARTGHLHPRLARDLEELARHTSRCPHIEYTPQRRDDPDDPPEFITWFERAQPHQLPLQTMDFRMRRHNGLTYCRYLVRADMMTQELADELNEEAPRYMGAYRYKQPDTLQQPHFNHALDAYGA